MLIPTFTDVLHNSIKYCVLTRLS